MIVLWPSVSRSTDVPKSPTNSVQVVAQDTEVTYPWPSTTEVVGSVTFVEPPVSVISTPGASSSTILTSIGPGVVDSPRWPAT